MKTTYPSFELKPETKNKTLSFGAKAWMLLGLACCLQYLFFGIVGVARGYSIQSWVPTWVMLIGVFMLMPFSKKKIGHLTSGLIILMSVVSMLQGRYESKGEELYELEKYNEAISEYRKEIDTWYLRIRYNYHEDMAMFGIAQCYSQLGQFEKCRETYTQMVGISRGYYQGRAEDELLELEENLIKIIDYETEMEKEMDDSDRAAILFDLARVYRRMPCSAKSIEQYELIEALDVREATKDQARAFADDMR